MAEEIVRADDDDAKLARQRRLMGISFAIALVLLMCCMLGVAVLGTWGRTRVPPQNTRQQMQERLETGTQTGMQTQR